MVTLLEEAALIASLPAHCKPPFTHARTAWQQARGLGVRLLRARLRVRAVAACSMQRAHGKGAAQLTVGTAHVHKFPREECLQRTGSVLLTFSQRQPETRRVGKIRPVSHHDSPVAAMASVMGDRLPVACKAWRHDPPTAERQQSSSLALTRDTKRNGQSQESQQLAHRPPRTRIC